MAFGRGERIQQFRLIAMVLSTDCGRSGLSLSDLSADPISSRCPAIKSPAWLARGPAAPATTKYLHVREIGGRSPRRLLRSRSPTGCLQCNWCLQILCTGRAGTHHLTSASAAVNALWVYLTKDSTAEFKNLNNKLCHNMPPPLQVDLWPFDRESGVRVTCDVGYICANFRLPRPLRSRLR